MISDHVNFSVGTYLLVSFCSFNDTLNYYQSTNFVEKPRTPVPPLGGSEKEIETSSLASIIFYLLYGERSKEPRTVGQKREFFFLGGCSNTTILDKSSNLNVKATGAGRRPQSMASTCSCRNSYLDYRKAKASIVYIVPRFSFRLDQASSAVQGHALDIWSIDLEINFYWVAGHNASLACRTVEILFDKYTVTSYSISRLLKNFY